MKSYLELIPLSAGKRKKRNRMTLLCIIIAVFLVTGIFSMADIAVQGERIHTVNKQGYWHFNLKNVSEEMMAEVAGEVCVKSFSAYNAANYNLDEDYSLNGKKMCLCCCDKGYLDIISQFEKNSYPKSDDEIIVNSSMKNILGLKKGDSVTVSTPYETVELTVSGFIDEDSLDVYDACGAFVTVSEFKKLMRGGEHSDEIMTYYRLKNNWNALKDINAIRDKYILSDEQLSTNNMLLAVYGSSDDIYIWGFFIIAAFLIVFVMAAGVFMIAGSISSSVSERTSFYGMLRCIGAGKSQIRRLVRLEALNWCKTAVPVGVLLGTMGAWGLSAVMSRISEEFADLPMFYISPIGILAGVISGALTVFLAASAPARRAAGVSPIAAVSGNLTESKKHKGIRQLSSKVERKLGFRFAFEEKKSLFLISGSFALCIVVMLLFVSMLQLLDEALPCLRDYAPDFSIYTEGYEACLDSKLVSALSSMKEVKNAFGRMYSQIPATGDYDISVIDLISYDELQFSWARKDVEKGNIDRAINEKGYVVSVFDKSNPLKVGDKLDIGGMEVEVAAVLNNSPFSSSDIPTIICSEASFESLVGHIPYSVIDVQISEEYMDMDQSVIRNILPEGMTLSDRRQTNKETKATYYAFNVTVYSFIFLLALISVINIINSISMSTSARMKQFGIMRAIGLDEGGLMTMVASQGTAYALIGILSGLILGIPIHRLSYYMMVTKHFGIDWQLPGTELLITFLVIMLATGIAVIKPVQKIKKAPVTEIIAEL